jgi:hypothetical protein
MLTAVFSGSPSAIAQEIEDNPPPIIQALTAQEEVLMKPTWGLNDSGLGDLGPILDIATNTNLDEASPAIAHCSPDVYLAVYERSGDIYGQYLNAEGAKNGGAFLISEIPGNNFNPDVACDWYRNKFVVTWQYLYDGGVDYDIRARGVYAIYQGDYLFGGGLWVAFSTNTETEPSIACNSDDHSCLIVYEYQASAQADLRGRRISIGTSGLSVPNLEFMISDLSDDERLPDLTWGGNEDEYYLVWHTTGTFGKQRTIWDTHQSSGSQTKSPRYSIESPAGTYKPVVAYNSRSGEYLIVYEQDVSGTRNIKAVRAMTTNDDILYMASPFIVNANSTTGQYYPAVAYSNGTQNINDGMGEDQFIVTYLLAAPSPQIVGQAIEGTYSASSSQKQGDPVVLDTAFGGTVSGLGRSDVTGSINNGKYFVIWEKWTADMSSNKYDIKGRLVTPISGNFLYLPLILR